MNYSSIQLHSTQPYLVTMMGMPCAELKDVNAKEGIVEGYFASFDNTDSYQEIIDPGAFAKTIVEWGPNSNRKRIAHLVDHNPTKRVAKIRELEEDGHGLRYLSKYLPTDHTLARDTLIELENGVLPEHSIGFDIVQEKRDTETGKLHLQELRLYEGSHVTWGANMETPVLDIKDLSQSSLAVRRLADHVKALQRCLGQGITDEKAIEIELRLAQFKQYLTAFETALREKDGPLHRDSTHDDEPQFKEEDLLEIIKRI